MGLGYSRCYDIFNFVIDPSDIVKMLQCNCIYVGSSQFSLFTFR